MTLLIFSYLANMESAASIHIDDRLYGLSQMKQPTILISSTIGEKIKDQIHHRIISLSPSGWRYELRHFLKQKINHKTLRHILFFIFFLPFFPLYCLECLFLKTPWFRCELSWAWGLSSAYKALTLFRKNKIAAIYSTGGPTCAHTAAYFVHLLTGTPWIAELQDPLIIKGQTKQYELNFLIEKIIFRYAKNIVFLCHGAAHAAALRYPTYQHKIAIIAPALRLLDTSTLNQPPIYSQNNTLYFQHFGTLAHTRNLDSFLAAMLELKMQYPESIINWELHLYGHVTSAILNSIEQSPFKQNVLYHGKIDRLTTHSLMKQQEKILLLIQDLSEGSSQSIPSKLYEYLQSGTFILGLTFNNAELDAMLSSHGHYVAYLTNSTSIAQSVLNLFNDKTKDKHPLNYEDTPKKSANKLLLLLS
jgi:glycosyltransferase involved in cell wall biosynthesis